MNASKMVEEHIFDLLPGYALGCLDEDELLRVARHLPDCPECRAELASYQAVMDHLVLASPLQTPSAGVKQKLLRRVRANMPGKRSRRGLFAGVRLPQPLALAALLLIAVLAVSNLLLWGQINRMQERLPAGDIRIVNLMGTENAPQARGYLMIFEQETYGTLVVENVPALEAGYQYQLWLIRDGKRTSGGLFSAGENGYSVLQVFSDLPLESFPSFGVTVEPEGGSPGPTGQKILGGDL